MKFGFKIWKTSMISIRKLLTLARLSFARYFGHLLPLPKPQHQALSQMKEIRNMKILFQTNDVLEIKWKTLWKIVAKVLMHSNYLEKCWNPEERSGAILLLHAKDLASENHCWNWISFPYWKFTESRKWIKIECNFLIDLLVAI